MPVISSCEFTSQATGRVSDSKLAGFIVVINSFNSSYGPAANSSMFSVQRELNYLKPTAVLHQLTGKRLSATIMTFPKLGYKAQRNQGREPCRRKEPQAGFVTNLAIKLCFPSTCHSLLLNLITVSSNENIMSSLETVACAQPSSPRAATSEPGEASPLGPHSEATTSLIQ